MGRSKNNIVGGLQGTKALAITAGGGTVSAQSSNVVDAVFITCTVAGTATVLPAGNTSTTVTIGLVPGSIFPLLVSNVTAATATGIVGIWS